VDSSWLRYYTVFGWVIAVAPALLWASLLFAVLRARGLLDRGAPVLTRDSPDAALALLAVAAWVGPLVGAAVGWSLLVAWSFLGYGAGNDLLMLYPGSELGGIMIAFTWWAAAMTVGGLAILLVIYTLAVRRAQALSRPGGAIESRANRIWFGIAHASAIDGLLLPWLLVPPFFLFWPPR
jgi:hypothetical protein